jgi:hypothetical protein
MKLNSHILIYFNALILTLSQLAHWALIGFRLTYLIWHRPWGWRPRRSSVVWSPCSAVAAAVLPSSLFGLYFRTPFNRPGFNRGSPSFWESQQSLRPWSSRGAVSCLRNVPAKTTSAFPLVHHTLFPVYNLLKILNLLIYSWKLFPSLPLTILPHNNHQRDV